MKFLIGFMNPIIGISKTLVCEICKTKEFQTTGIYSNRIHDFFC